MADEPPPKKRLLPASSFSSSSNLFGRTKHVLYVALRSHPTATPRWYILNSKPITSKTDPINPKLVPIPLFPSIPCWGTSIAAIGSEIYVLGGSISDKFVSTAFAVDCPSHTFRLLPNMKQARGGAAVGFLNGKLYVIGGCDPLSLNWIEAFDLKTQSWETVFGVRNVTVHNLTIRSLVIDDKIYFMDRSNSFVYDPKEGRLESDAFLNDKWRIGSCVIDNRLYTFGWKNEIRVFNPISRVWDSLKGLEDLPEKHDTSRMANLGGNLVIMSKTDKRSTEISVTEIELERREGGETWGRILWSNVVINSEDPYTIVSCLAVAI